MPKKEPTPKQLEARRKFAEQARLRAAERKAAKEEPKINAVEKGPDLEPGEKPREVISEDAYLDLQRQVLELKAMLMTGTPLPQQNVGFRGGSLVGSLEKFSLAPTDYPNPIERLFKEPRLARFALDINYDLMWKVSTVEYTTIDNVRVKEPRFTLELGRKLFDEDTGEPQVDNNGLQKGYIISRFIFHEDPDAAIDIARKEGIDVDETNEKAFLDEMRYLRCRDFLIECFFPSPIKKEEKREMVVGGKVVETYTITSTNSEKIPFDEIKGSMLKG